MLPLFLLTVAALPSSLDRALDRGVFAGTPAGFRIIALSNLADGCAARMDRRCVERAYARAKALGKKSSGSGLYATHLALIMGAGDRTGPCLDENEHRRIAESLARGSLRDPTFHLASYAARPERWPADQSATLAALHRYDLAHRADLARQPLDEWKRYVEKHAIDRTTGLPRAEARGRGTGRFPRGCALSYSVRYLAEVDPVLASSWWERYRERFLVDLGVMVGFREWPPGMEKKADVDSGPIIQGVGAAATAFGIAAARAMDDDLLAARLETTALIVNRAAQEDAALARIAESTLAQAILFQASAQQSLVD